MHEWQILESTIKDLKVTVKITEKTERTIFEMKNNFADSLKSSLPVVRKSSLSTEGRSNHPFEFDDH